MNDVVKIAVVGIGNLGWNLSNRLADCGFDIHQIVCSKTEPNQKLATRIGAEIVENVDLISKSVSLVFLCVPDDQLAPLSRTIERQFHVVHTSGSTPVFISERSAGVFYPFQTFTKFFLVDWQGVPVFIESNNDNLKTILHSIAAKVSGNVMEVTLEQRQAIHLSGVFGANFVNHVLYLAKSVLDRNGVGYSVLEPLLKETIRKAFEHGPAGSQTGPARRGDMQMVERHLHMLKDEKVLRDFYKLFSDSIIDQYSK